MTNQLPPKAARAPSATGPAIGLDRRVLGLSHGHATYAVLLLVLALRLIHFLYASHSPLTYQIGPDEDYYLRFGMDVALGSGGMTSEFAFMDPLYGYLLGSVVWLSGGSVFPMYVLQVLVDCATAYGLVLIGRELGQPRTGLVAALLYACLGPAMAFTMSLLKATWVAAFVCWWMYAALRMLRSGRPGAWITFGLYCGLGIALRSNLILLVAIGLVLVPWLHRRCMGGSMIAACRHGAWMLPGLALPLLLLAARNHAIDGRWSPLPSNGGVVLHQLYNPENPDSRSSAPSFVRYGHPSEIWRGYRAEAERRAGKSLTAGEIETAWRGEAQAYLLAHPVQDIRNSLRKLAEFSAYPEVPNNRSYQDERRFSPLLRWLPQPFGWLFALGLPGLVLVSVRDRRGLVLLAPVAMGLATIAVFFAEDRFRFAIVTPFVYAGAAWLAWLASALGRSRWRAAGMGILLSALLGAWSVWQARFIEPVAMDWQRIATGYLKMGERRKALDLLDEVARSQHDPVGLHEFRGLIALQDGAFEVARSELEAALAQRNNRHEVWHNYAVTLEALGERDAALVAELHAYQLQPRPEYTARIGALLQSLGRVDEARSVYQALRDDPDAGKWRAIAAGRLRRLPPPSR